VFEGLLAGAGTGDWGGAICGIAGGCMEGIGGMPIGGMPGICPAGGAAAGGTAGGGGTGFEGTEIILVYSLGPCGGAAGG